MKRIIDGKRYDTETAVCIADYDSGLSCRDFNHYSESLYRTKTGNYFLVGGGGPMSKYAVSNGNTTSGSHQMFPISKEKALKWCESHEIDADIIEKEFSDMVTDA